MKVTTESGSIYEFKDFKMRRVNDTDALRRDGDWLKMLTKPVIMKGLPMFITLEPLGDGDVTMRSTTAVIRIEK